VVHVLSLGEDTLPALNPARLLLAVCDPELSQVPRPNMLTDMFRLAPAEARVAIGIPAGRQLAEIAADRGVKIETVRAHSRCSPKVIALSGE
jgi:hypothetical protein